MGPAPAGLADEITATITGPRARLVFIDAADRRVGQFRIAAAEGAVWFVGANQPASSRWRAAAGALSADTFHRRAAGAIGTFQVTAAVTGGATGLAGQPATYGRIWCLDENRATPLAHDRIAITGLFQRVDLFAGSPLTTL